MVKQRKEIIMLTPQQKYDRSEKGLERHRKYYSKNKKKNYAEQMARYYHPIPQVCSIKGCNEIGERHHTDYKKVADIIWLCRKHHLEIHGKVRGKCKICGKPAHARELCNNHYAIWLRKDLKNR